MKLFGRTSGYYLFWAGFIYLAVGFINIQYKFAEPAVLSLAWIVFLLIPLTVKPVADYFNMSTFWSMITPRKTMSDYTDNVYNLPTPKLVTPLPDVTEPVESTEPAYQIGRTEDGRITLRLGTNRQWSQVVMNDAGVDTLIRMLEAARDE
jgi:hypothetical protein